MEDKALREKYEEYRINEENNVRVPDSFEVWCKRSKNLSPLNYELFSVVNHELKNDKSFNERVARLKGAER